MQIYLVGGAVRDQLLGLPVKEKDWLVVGATVEDMLSLGYRQVEANFPVFIHPETGEEYALARREIKIGHGYHGFKVEYGPDITLEEDLRRRDLTINAMAKDEQGHLIDLFAGQEDLQQGYLRHISPAFVEDPLRLLRIARFNARFAHWGFRIAHGTFGLLKKMVRSGELAYLAPARWMRELAKAMDSQQPWRFFETLQRCGALAQILPDLLALMPEEQTHQDQHYPLKHFLQAAKTAEQRWILVLYHLADLDDFELPRSIKKKALALQSLKMICDQNDPNALLNWLRHHRAELAELAVLAKIIALPLSLEQAQHCLAVNSQAFQEQGLVGAELGQAIQKQQLHCLQRLLCLSNNY